MKSEYVFNRRRLAFGGKPMKTRHFVFYWAEMRAYENEIAVTCIHLYTCGRSMSTEAG